MEEKKCPGTCDREQQTCIPFFVAENQVMHMDKTNKRMLVALLAVCITFILTIIIFVFGYTVRERNWLNTLKQITPTVEVPDGIQQQPDS